MEVLTDLKHHGCGGSIWQCALHARSQHVHVFFSHWQSFGEKDSATTHASNVMLCACLRAARVDNDHVARQ